MQIIVLFLLFLSNFVSGNVLQSDGNTLSGICDNILSSLQILNKNQILRLINRDRCRNYELLGEKILNLSDKSHNYCYGGVQFLFCNLRYQPYESNFNCEHIKDKFIKIMKTCSSYTPNALEKNCSSINSENLTIFDSVEFCRTNYVTLNEVRDGSYEAMCKNFVLPFVFSKLMEDPESLNPSVCAKADENISKSILNLRDQLMFKSKSFFDAFESEFAYKKWVQDLESRLDGMVIDLRDLINQSNLCFQYLNYPHRFFYAYDNVVVSRKPDNSSQIGEFAKAKEIVDRIYNNFNQLSHLPQEIVQLINHIDSVINMDNAIKEANIHFRDLYTLLRRDRTLQNNMRVMESNLNRISLFLPNNIAHIKQKINSGTPFEANLGKASMLHQRANDFKNIASLLEAQLTALYKIIAKSKDSNFIRSLNLT
ncbi:conserved hypothetical protein [Theileria orientalis strain Shintoku]|uniref:Uncharacterized protein n=1 Tax=Theileria orientalis strain Shintoku TaxID=869250 RepID=J4D9D4_THEOR|nr:conserved hypothetical protein [Theileria orientalis strain Shintoku]BAM41310.1 conserved hypothetical protein [Theileria orientalis strain Shintoku]|eukprot:XP_009691611.1 conserved hypothetical protein [Theileria orientalis strain Shintoku]